jgi:serine protease Do
MSAQFILTRKTVLSLVAAAMLSTTAVVTSFAVAPPLSVAAGTQAAIDPSRGFSELVDRVMPAVVDVTVKFTNASNQTSQAQPNLDLPPQLREFFEQFPQFRNQLPDGMPGPGPRQKGMAQGAGFVISADGYVVTNNHVVQDANEVKVSFQDGEEYDATVIGTDPKTDLALLKIKSDKAFPAVDFATSEAKVGDWVMAVGNPFGLGGTVTSGIVSARGRDIGNGPYDDFLQIDASINRGNSGGPAFNIEGDVIGVNTAIFSPSGGSVGIGFAIPAAQVKEIVESLKANGAVTRGWLGVKIQPVTPDLAESLGLDEAAGAIISELTENSPALKSGLQAGDTIVKFDGRAIKDARDLSRSVARLAPGKPVAVDIVRDGKPLTLNITLGAMPDQVPKMAGAPQAKPTDDALSSLGLEVAPADDGEGLKILAVKPNSAAEERGLKPGDVILEVAGAEVDSAADMAQLLKEGGNKKVLLLLRSGADQRYVALPRDRS